MVRRREADESGARSEAVPFTGGRGGCDGRDVYAAGARRGGRNPARDDAVFVFATANDGKSRVRGSGSAATESHTVGRAGRARGFSAAHRAAAAGRSRKAGIGRSVRENRSAAGARSGAHGSGGRLRG